MAGFFIPGSAEAHSLAPPLPCQTRPPAALHARHRGDRQQPGCDKEPCGKSSNPSVQRTSRCDLHSTPHPRPPTPAPRPPTTAHPANIIIHTGPHYERPAGWDGPCAAACHCMALIRTCAAFLHGHVRDLVAGLCPHMHVRARRVGLLPLWSLPACACERHLSTSRTSTSLQVQGAGWVRDAGAHGVLSEDACFCFRVGGGRGCGDAGLIGCKGGAVGRGWGWGEGEAVPFGGLSWPCTRVKST